MVLLLLAKDAFHVLTLFNMISTIFSAAFPSPYGEVCLDASESLEHSAISQGNGDDFPYHLERSENASSISSILAPDKIFQPA